jgi:hypothetical protein
VIASNEFPVNMKLHKVDSCRVLDISYPVSDMDRAQIKLGYLSCMVTAGIWLEYGWIQLVGNLSLILEK